MTLSLLEEWVAGGPLDLFYVLATDHISQRFCREVVVWKTLRHPNVLPLLGVTMTENRLVVVSEWMANGNINEFVKVNIGVDRLGLVRFPFNVPTFAPH